MKHPHALTAPTWSSRRCAAVMSTVTTLLLAFSGFLVQKVPFYWEWIRTISFCTYAYRGLVRNEFEDLKVSIRDGGMLVPALPLVPPIVEVDNATVIDCIGLVCASTAATTVLLIAFTSLAVRIKWL